MSPPSRAAWIEITGSEGKLYDFESPPSRAAWIEIPSPYSQIGQPEVAAFTGGVD